MDHTASGAAPRVARRRADPNTGFAWLRMIGALTVVVDHSTPLTDPSRVTVLPESWNLSPGYIALMGFFAMSGYQISDSWRQDPCWWRFSAKRVLRIWPPLLVVVICTAVVIGPLVTRLPTRDYFASNGTWGYIVNNAGMYTLQHELPGVFTGNPYPWSANGAIWTLPMELTGYLLVLAFGLVALIRRSRWLTVVLLLAMVALDRRFQYTPGEPGGGGSFLSVPIGALTAFLVAFALGMVLHAYRDKIPLSPAVALALVGLQIAVQQTDAGPFMLPLMAGYGAVVLAHHWPARLEGYGRWVYGSYGAYVWGFPIQQLLIMAGVTQRWYLALLAVPLAYVVGCLSWRYVEEPTMSLRRYLTPRRRPAPRNRTADETYPIPRVEVPAPLPAGSRD
ncbi:MAG: acyltransferase family protein [Pseudonocardiaceae bacterium]